MRELELIYKLYEEEFEEVKLEEDFKLNEETKNKLFDMFRKNPAKLENSEKAEKIRPGNIYLMFIKHVPVYYVVYEKIDNLYEVLKASKWVYLAAQNDYLVTVNDEWFVVETWNRFYLEETEIKSHAFIGKLSNEDWNTLQNIIEGNLEIPENKRGLEVDLLDESFFQTKFHKKEAEIVYEYKMRLFSEILAEEEEEAIYLEPERLSNFKLTQLAASTETSVAYRENFILDYDEELNVLKLHLPNYVSKKGSVEIAGQKISYDQIPEIIYIDLSVDIKELDIEKLADSIKIEVNQ